MSKILRADDIVWYSASDGSWGESTSLSDEWINININKGEANA
jgi:hypothetical protein